MTTGSLVDLLALTLTLSPQLPDPATAVEELLRADRAFAAQAASVDLPEALGAMFAEDVLMPGPGGTFLRGREAAVAALRAEPANRGVRATWTPARGGISADGLHGFTLGTMEVAPAPTRDSSHAAAGEGTPRRGAKYLAYWVRGEAGWRVAAYKRAPRPSAGAALDPMSPALPPRMVAPSTDEARVAGLERGLRAAEQAFSDEAQRIGLGPAFARHGSPDATNMGGPDESGFLVGADAIGRAVGGPDPSAPSPVAWSADEVLVASSGDLGITFGMIRPHAPIAGQPAGFPFFTIWRRSDPADPWRYVAE